jgi:hypothetical protein
MLQAPGSHRAPPADKPGLIDGPQRGPGDPVGEEKLRIGVAAGGAVPPVLDLVLAGHCPARTVKAWLALAWVMARAPSLTSVHGGDIYPPPRRGRSRPGNTPARPRASRHPALAALARTAWVSRAGRPATASTARAAAHATASATGNSPRQLSGAGDAPSLIGRLGGERLSPAWIGVHDSWLSPAPAGAVVQLASVAGALRPGR